MNKPTTVISILLSGVILGAVAHAALAPAPAYVVISGRTIDAEGLQAYREAAGPGALAAGIEMLAQSTTADVTVLEGAWPYQGFVAVERYRSMNDLLEFWNSDAYQAAIALREGKIELDFVIAVAAD